MVLSMRLRLRQQLPSDRLDRLAWFKINYPSVRQSRLHRSDEKGRYHLSTNSAVVKTPDVRAGSPSPPKSSSRPGTLPHGQFLACEAASGNSTSRVELSTLS